MDEKTRIEKDIIMFEQNLTQLQLQGKTLSMKQNKTVELAKQYFNDAKYYFEKEDLFTSFGCINYAHGLLDSIIKA
jgi:hypothetical protein